MTMLHRLTCLVLAMLCALPAAAQPVTERLPGDALLYVGWYGSTKRGADYNTSRLRALLDDSDLELYVQKVVPEVLKNLAEQQPHDAEMVAVIVTTLQRLYRYPTALYFGGMGAPAGEGQPPMPKIAIVSVAGDDSAKIVDAVKPLLADAPVPIQLEHEGGTVLLHLGLSPDAAKLLKGQGDAAASLSKNETFQKTMGKHRDQAVLAAYIDIEKLMPFVDMGMAMSGDPDVGAMWPKLKVALGLDGVKRFAWTAGFIDRNWQHNVHIAAPAARRGLVKVLMDHRPLALNDIAPVPHTAMLAAAGRFDPAAFIAATREGVKAVDPDAVVRFDEAMMNASKTIGMDIQKDLLEPFGDAWTFYNDGHVGGTGMFGAVMVNRLDDEGRARDALMSLANTLNRVFVEQIEDEDLTLALKKVKIDGVDIHYLGTPLLTPAFAIHDGRLYAAMYPQIVASAVAFAKSDGKSLAANPDFVAMRKKVDANVTAFNYVDLPRTAPHAYETVLALSRLSGFAEMFGIEDAPPMILPPMHKLRTHLTPIAGFSWVDDDGWYAQIVEPFPFSFAFGMQQNSLAGVQTSAMGVGILLPALGAARRTANRVKASTQARAVIVGAITYAADHDDTLPPDMASFVGTYVTPGLLIHPLDDTPAPRDWARMSADDKAEWIKKHSAFEYVPGPNDMNASKIMIYEKRDHFGDGEIAVGFRDGHVVRMDIDEAMDMLAKQQRGDAK